MLRPSRDQYRKNVLGGVSREAAEQPPTRFHEPDVGISGWIPSKNGYLIPGRGMPRGGTAIGIAHASNFVARPIDPDELGVAAARHRLETRSCRSVRPTARTTSADR